MMDFVMAYSSYLLIVVGFVLLMIGANWLVNGASGLAKLLAELGRLPDCDEAREAYERTDEGRRLPLFVPRREAR